MRTLLYALVRLSLIGVVLAETVSLYLLLQSTFYWEFRQIIVSTTLTVLIIWKTNSESA